MPLLFLFFSCLHPNTSENLPINIDSYQKILQKQDLPIGTPISNGIQTPVETEFGIWQLSIQYFPEKKILYLAINNYLWLDSSSNVQSTVFSMTQMLTQNHSMLGGKFQLNPSSGAITIGTELVAFETFSEEEIQHSIEVLILLAKDNYPMLDAALQSRFY